MDLLLCVLKALSCTLSTDCCISICVFYLCVVFVLLSAGFTATIGWFSVLYLFLLFELLFRSGKRCSLRAAKHIYRLLCRRPPKTTVVPVQESLATSTVVIISCGEPKFSLGIPSFDKP